MTMARRHGVHQRPSTRSHGGVMGPLRELLAIDHRQALEVFVLLMHDRLMMETAGAQCLLLAGFFEDQMHPRHNIRWYAELGARFFSRAALPEQSRHKARLLDAIVRRFELWRRHHAQLSRELRDQPYLLTPPMPPTPSSGRKECSSIEVRDLPC